MRGGGGGGGEALNLQLVLAPWGWRWPAPPSRLALGVGAPSTQWGWPPPLVWWWWLRQGRERRAGGGVGWGVGEWAAAVNASTLLGRPLTSSRRRFPLQLPPPPSAVLVAAAAAAAGGRGRLRRKCGPALAGMVSQRQCTRRLSFADRSPSLPRHCRPRSYSRRRWLGGGGGGRAGGRSCGRAGGGRPGTFSSRTVVAERASRAAAAWRGDVGVVGADDGGYEAFFYVKLAEKRAAKRKTDGDHYSTAI